MMRWDLHDRVRGTSDCLVQKAEPGAGREPMLVILHGATKRGLSTLDAVVNRDRNETRPSVPIHSGAVSVNIPYIPCGCSQVAGMVGGSHEVLLGQAWSGAAIKSGAGDFSSISCPSEVEAMDCGGWDPWMRKRVWRNPCLEKKAPVPGGCAALHAFVFDGGLDLRWGLSGSAVR